jgi:uncharacterized protein YceK
MRGLMLALAVVALLAGCGAVVTPVDHECPGNPGWGTDSGCS